MSASRATSAASRARAGSSTATAVDSSDAPSGVVELDRLAQAAHRRLALVRRQPVEHEHAVEVVDLVLHDAGLAALGVDHEAGPRPGGGGGAHPGGSRDLDPAPRQAETALGEALLL